MMRNTRFVMAFNIGQTNEERLEAFTMHQRAFGAVKILESTAPGFDDIHIVMGIG